MEQLNNSKMIYSILDNKKAIDLKLFDTNNVSLLADYFIVATGTSSTHVKALAEEVEYEMKQKGIQAKSIEGYGSNSWILLDYGEIIVHVFTEEARNFYNIEALWNGMKKVEMD